MSSRKSQVLSSIFLYNVLTVLGDRLLRYTDRCTEEQCPDGKVYHCLLDSTREKLGEWCLERKLMIEPMQCPYYNLHGNTGNLDTRPCREMYSAGCPQEAYHSDRSFYYSDCVEKEKSSTTTPSMKNATQLTHLHTTIFHSTVKTKKQNKEIPTTVQNIANTNTPQPQSSDQGVGGMPILIIVLPAAGGVLLAAIIILVVMAMWRRRPPPHRPIDVEGILNRQSESSDVSNGENCKSSCISQSLISNRH